MISKQKKIKTFERKETGKANKEKLGNSSTLVSRLREHLLLPPPAEVVLRQRWGLRVRNRPVIAKVIEVNLNNDM